jgi:hypothetical protein
VSWAIRVAFSSAIEAELESSTVLQEGTDSSSAKSGVREENTNAPTRLVATRRKRFARKKGFIAEILIFQ